jgi:uncharacterized protein with PIN domain
LGRLARSLRVLGHDKVYATGMADADIARRARDESRTLVTRDRELARRVPDSVLLGSGSLGDQLLQLRQARPEASWEPRFDRCTVCNGELRAVPADGLRAHPGSPTLPPAVLTGHEPLYRCGECGHPYWDGSHTRDMRARYAQLFGGTVPS